MDDYQDIALENALYPWLDDDSMADETSEYYPGEPGCFCDKCGCGIYDEDEPCPDCGEEA